jgi:hypothetical protein
MPATPTARPAWKEPLLWLVVSIPAATVVAGVLTVVIAHGGAEMQRAPGVQVTAQIQTAIAPPPATDPPPPR